MDGLETLYSALVNVPRLLITVGLGGPKPIVVLGNPEQVTIVVVAYPDKDAEMVQALTITHRQPEDAHCKRNVGHIVIKGDDHIIEFANHPLQMVIEVHAKHIHVMEGYGRGRALIILIVRHVMRHRRRIDGKQARLVLDILVHNVAMEVGLLYPIGIAARLDKSAELVEEPDGVITHLTKADDECVKRRGDCGVFLNIHIADRLQFDLLFQHLHTDVGGINNLHHDVIVQLLILNHAMHTVVARLAIEEDLYPLVGDSIDRHIPLEIAHSLDIVVGIVGEEEQMHLALGFLTDDSCQLLEADVLSQDVWMGWMNWTFWTIWIIWTGGFSDFIQVQMG